LLVSSPDGNVSVGHPYLDGVSVNTEVLKHVRSKKIIVFKKKRRHNYRRKAGHRQWLTVLKVGEIVFPKAV
jgi:large subunit ribosomal protein L21